MQYKIIPVFVLALAMCFISRAVADALPILTTLSSFSPTNGEFSLTSLVLDASGNLYGTTDAGGSNNVGTIFGLPATTHVLAPLASFSGTYNGSTHNSSLTLDAQGDLFGTTDGGTTDDGKVIELPFGAHALTTIASFNGANGKSPEGGVIFDSHGNLYGTTKTGGANGFGTVFETSAPGTPSTLFSFDINNGQFPVAGLVADGAGNLYGTAPNGGDNQDGTVFEISANTHVLKTLASFNGANGDYPDSTLSIDVGGNLFGTTEFGGTAGDGVIFELPASTRTLAPLVSFSGANGSMPSSGVILDAAGNLFGTTNTGGAIDDGTVFEWQTQTRTLLNLATFDAANGANPYAGLVADSVGNLYGATSNAGPTGIGGTIFELTGSGFVVPEPATLSLLIIAPLAMLRRRRNSKPHHLPTGPVSPA